MPVALVATTTTPNVAVAGEADPGFTPQELMGLSLDDLASLHITSVSPREQNIPDAAASIYAITADDMRRSGATSLPEILQLAPNLQVARIESVDYAISARGFNNSIGNKLLVLLGDIALAPAETAGLRLSFSYFRLHAR